jgi:hypothetical protein
MRCVMGATYNSIISSHDAPLQYLKCPKLIRQACHICIKVLMISRNYHSVLLQV